MSTTVIDPVKTREVAELKYDTALTTCRIDPTGRFVFAGAEDRNVVRWNLDSGDRQTSTGHESWVRSLDFSRDGKTLVTAGWDGQLRWWETGAPDPHSLRVVQAHRGFARWVRTSPCGKLLATCGNDKLIRVWDIESGDVLREMTGHLRHPYAVDFHPHENQLASEDLMGQVFTWDLETSQRSASIDAGVMTGYDQKFAADMGGARDMRFNADGRTLACAGVTNVVNAFAGTQDPLIVLIDWETKRITHHLRQTKTTTGIAWGVRFHPLGFILGCNALQNGKGELVFWRTEDKPPSKSQQPRQPAEPSSEAAAAPSSDQRPAKPVELKPFHTLPLAKCARGVDLTPDGRRLAVAHSDGAVRVYEMADAPNAPPSEAKS